MQAGSGGGGGVSIATQGAGGGGGSGSGAGFPSGAPPGLGNAPDYGTTPSTQPPYSKDQTPQGSTTPTTSTLADEIAAMLAYLNSLNPGTTTQNVPIPFAAPNPARTWLLLAIAGLAIFGFYLWRKKHHE